MTASPRAARRCRSGSVRSVATSTMTAAGWWKAPTRFLPSGRSTAVLPPIELSSWATSVVGTWISGTPAQVDRGQEAGASPSAPPPIATSGSPRSTRRSASARAACSIRLRRLAASPCGQHRPSSTRQPAASSAAAIAVADRRPRRRARRRAAPGAASSARSCLDHEPSAGDPVAEDDPADRRRPRQRGSACRLVGPPRATVLDRVDDGPDLGQRR